MQVMRIARCQTVAVTRTTVAQPRDLSPRLDIAQHHQKRSKVPEQGNSQKPLGGSSIPGDVENDCATVEDELSTQSSEHTEEARRQALLVEVREALEESIALHQSFNVRNAPEVAQMLRALEEKIVAARAAGLPREENCLLAAEVLRRHLHNVNQDLLGAVRVFCRVRPMAVGRAGCPEWESGAPVTSVTGTMSVEVEGAGEFVFDAVFDGDASQEEVFVECRNLMQSVVDGYPVTLFCYGQTGAGKTYTMYGNEKHAGIAPRAVSELFRLCDEQAERRKCRVYASMVELYNNDLADLLKVAGYDKKETGGSGMARARGGSGPPRHNRSLSPRRVSLVSNSNEPLTEVECFSAEELSRLLWDGFAQRHVAATAMNGDSSRSHVVLLIRVNGRDLATNLEHNGYMALVDLGGSERLKKSASTGGQQKEAIEINRSLTAIGDVVEALARGLRGPQVPYRNHKLTLLLQDALGGSSKTLMVVNVAPSSAHRGETVMALRFGQRAGAVLNRVQGRRCSLTSDRKKATQRRTTSTSEDLSGLGHRRPLRRTAAEKEQRERDQASEDKKATSRLSKSGDQSHNMVPPSPSSFAGA